MKRYLAILLSLLFLASCGDDDKPTGPQNDQLDSRLVGTWTVRSWEGADLEEAGIEISFTLEENGTMKFKMGLSGVSVEFPGSWSTDGNRLTMDVYGGSFNYKITGGELTFTTVTPGMSDLDDYVFTTDGDPADALTGVTWVDEDEDELVFHSDGTYRWGDDLEEGSWTTEGSTITIHLTSTDSFIVRGNTLTITGSDGEEIVAAKE